MTPPDLPVFQSTAEFTEPPISRKEAGALGRKFFFSGKPCIRGHVVRRYVSTGTCVLCQRQHSNDAARMNRAYRTQRGGAQAWALFESPPELMETICATIKALGGKVKDAPVGPKEAFRMQRAATDWAPPADLVRPVIVQSEPAMVSGDAQRWLDREGETVDVSHLALPPPPPLPPTPPDFTRLKP